MKASSKQQQCYSSSPLFRDCQQTQFAQPVTYKRNIYIHPGPSP